ncbi:MAG: hypothetical protein HDR56_09020 [Treponema sp.]|nr:hypothetical protein [Treponema sp.]
MTSFRWKLAYQMPLLISLRSGIKWRGRLWGETGFVMRGTLPVDTRGFTIKESFFDNGHGRIDFQS